jgi:hemerythrin-like domain-containing protein
MLTRISSGLNPVDDSQERDALELLLGCHSRIRHFTDMALRLAQNADQAPPDDLARAAAAVHRYFTVALPLHEADENESLYPRMRAALADGDELTSALDAMVAQHRDIDAVIAGLVPVWERVREEPSAAPPLQSHLLAGAERLDQLWATHLKLEEEFIIPLVRRRLPISALDGIFSEMRARRA